MSYKLNVFTGTFDIDTTSSSGGANPLYIGDSGTDGSWRFIIVGNDLSVQRRESGVWVEKGSFMP